MRGEKCDNGNCPNEAMEGSPLCPQCHDRYVRDHNARLRAAEERRDPHHLKCRPLGQLHKRPQLNR